MTMHAHSLAAYDALDLSRREREALDALDALGGRATDRQIARQMGSQDMNISRPRISQLINKGILCEVGEMEDPETGRMVRIVGRAP